MADSAGPTPTSSLINLGRILPLDTHIPKVSASEIKMKVGRYWNRMKGPFNNGRESWSQFLLSQRCPWTEENGGRIQNKKPRNVPEVTWEKQYESQSWRNFTLDNAEKILGGTKVTTIVYCGFMILWLNRAEYKKIRLLHTALQTHRQSYARV